MDLINTPSLKTRNHGIDLLRIVSMLMIPILHILGHGGILSNTVLFSFKYEFAWLLELLCFGAVNCFILITGYVYFGKKTAYYRLLTIWAEVLFYSIIITLIFLCLMPNEVTFDQLWPSIIPSFFTDGNSSIYWFFSAYLGMYILSPFINIGLNVFNKKQDIIVVSTIFIIFSLLPTIFSQNFALTLNNGYSVLWFMILYYIGGIIHKYNIADYLNNKKWILIWIICCLTAWFLKLIIEFFFTESSFYSFISYISPLYLIGSIAFFCYFKNLKISNSFSISLINFFAPVCFGVYLIHDNPLIRKYFIENTFTFLTNMNSIFMILMILLSGLVIFICCSLIDWIREIIFRKLKVKSRFADFEEDINSKLDKLIQSN